MTTPERSCGLHAAKTSHWEYVQSSAERLARRPSALTLRQQHAGGGAKDQHKAEYIRKRWAVAEEDHCADDADHRVDQGAKRGHRGGEPTDDAEPDHIGDAGAENPVEQNSGPGLPMQ